MFKSIFSIFTELLNTIKLLPNLVSLLITFFKAGRRDLDQGNVNKDKNKEAFNSIKVELKADKDSAARWKNYLGTCMCIQLIFCMLLLISIYYLSFNIIVYSFFLIISTVSFGYKPFILKKRECFSFREYLLKLKEEPSILWLPNSLNLVEDLWQEQ